MARFTLAIWWTLFSRLSFSNSAWSALRKKSASLYSLERMRTSIRQSLTRYSYNIMLRLSWLADDVWHRILPASLRCKNEQTDWALLSSSAVVAYSTCLSYWQKLPTSLFLMLGACMAASCSTSLLLWRSTDSRTMAMMKRLGNVTKIMQGK